MTDQVVGILYLIDTLSDVAGTEVNLYQTVKLLDKKRFRPVVSPLQPIESPMIARIRSLGVRVEPLGLDRPYTCKARVAAHRLQRLIQEEKIALVHSIHLGSDFFAILWKRLWGNPVLISSRRDMGFNEPRLRHLWLRRVMNHFVARTLTNSRVMRAAIASREHLPLERICTIYNGVAFSALPDRDRRTALARACGFDPELPIVGCIANRRPIKGLEYLIEAVARLNQERPPVQLALIGGDALIPAEAEAYSSRLERMVAESNMVDRVRMLGRRDDAAELLQMMDVFVLPSLSEGFSNALLEAMAAGLGIVATRVGGNPEAVIHGESGLLVPPADASALCREIGKLLDDRLLRDRLGAAARLRAEERFTYESMISSLEAIYDECLGRMPC